MNKCVECSKLQRTCCEDCEIGVTHGDIDRISAFTGRDDFYHLQPVAEKHRQAYDNPHNIRQNTDIYVACFFDTAGRRTILRQDSQSRCCFLTPDGCALPGDVRPIVCRLHPYDWDDRGDVWVDMGCCPPSLFVDEKELEEQVCLPREDAKKLVALFYLEI